MTENKKRKREQLDDKEVETLFLDIDRIVDHAKSQIKEKKSRATSDFVSNLRANLGERVECVEEDLKVFELDKPWGSLTNIEYTVNTYKYHETGSFVLKFTDSLGSNWRLRGSIKYAIETGEESDSDFDVTPSYAVKRISVSFYHESPHPITGAVFIDDLRTLLVHIIYQNSEYKSEIDQKMLRDAIRRSVR